MEKYELLAFKFREAIELAIDNNETGIFFDRFPIGQCGFTSDLLAQFYIDNGIRPIYYANGTYYGEEYDMSQSHAWLIVNDSIVDITGDQFKYRKDLFFDVPVFIAKSSEFHSLFQINPDGIHEHNGIKKEWTNYRDLIDAYCKIQKYIIGSK